MTAKRPKLKMFNIVINMMLKGEDEKVIFSELCHKHGLKVDNARRNIRNARKVFPKIKHDNEKVEVDTMFGGKATIARKDVGTMHDPSQERYWSF